MAFSQVIAAFHAGYNVIGLPGNLLVIVSIILESRFHVMRYILLASLALSDFLLLVLVNSFRIKSIAQEHWLYGQTMCYLSPFFVRYFYLNTVLHLVAVSYDRYLKIVKSPLTYLQSGAISKNRMSVFRPITTIIVPFLVILFLNVSVYKTASRHINAIEVQVGGLVDAEISQQQESVSRRLTDRKAAVDVTIIIAAFLVCFLPFWVTVTFRQFVQGVDVSLEADLSTTCIFFLSAICNPIIYSIRKREFRNAVKKMFRRIRICQNSIDNNIVCQSA